MEAESTLSLSLLIVPGVGERLTRLKMIHVRSPIYFVTACTAGRRPLLASADVHRAIISFAENGPDLGAWIGGYVLMPDHLHAFVSLDDEQLTLAAWMKSLKHAVAKTLRARGVSMPVWQKGFFDRLLRSEESAGQKWHYMRENPVRAGLVQQWEDWPYGGQIFELDHRVERA